MVQLNLPSYQFRIRKAFGKPQIFDSIRKKFVSLTPEEWVRQNFIQFLVTEKKFPAQLLRIESKHDINTRNKRCDIIACTPEGTPLVVIECKASHIPIDQSTIEQISIYNLTQKASHLIVTNGLAHYSTPVDLRNFQVNWSQDVPEYSTVISPLK